MAKSIVLIGLLCLFPFLVNGQRVLQRYPIYSGAPPDSVGTAELWFQMENNSADSSGNARDATYSWNYTTTDAPQGSYWLTSNGSSSDFIPLDFTHNDTITMFCRMRYDATSVTNLAEWGFFAPDNSGWVWRLDAANDAIDFDKKVSGTTYYSRSSNGVLDINTLFSLAVVVRGQHTRFFVDGSKVASPDSVTTSGAMSPSDSLTITSILYGEFDDFQFYNRAVPDDSILYLHNHVGYILKYLPAE